MKGKFTTGRFYKAYMAFALALVLILVDGIFFKSAEAQGERWSQPRVMPGFDLNSWPPILIADQNKTVHAFSSQWIGEEAGGERFKAVVYNQWSLENGWTNPNDIILSPSKEARITDAYLDGEGKFHVIFWGGDSTAADIYYSRAYLWGASEARAWSMPVIIAENAGDPAVAVFAEDDQGTLYVIYSGRVSGNGLYVVYSKDDGETWSNSVPIFFASNDAPNINQLRVVKGGSGLFHAVWGVFNSTAQGRGIYYANFRDGINWSEPILLADTQEGLGTRDPALFEYKNIIFTIFNLPLDSSRFVMRRSMDGGETWDDPSTIFSRHIGANGSPSFAMGSDNVLHLFFGQRIPGTPDFHGMWHSTWVENRWTEPEAIIKGPQVSDKVGDKSFDPSYPKATVSQGKVILVTWATDPGLKGNGVWYSYKTLDAPGLPINEPAIQTVPEITFTPDAFDIPKSPDQTPTQYPVDTPPLPDNLFSSTERDRGITITLGLILGILLILGLIINKYFDWEQT